MYAVILTGGKQYRVQVGDVVYIERLAVEEGDTVSFDSVLTLGEEGGTAKIGTPVVEGAKVVGKAVRNGKGKKIVVFTYRAKKGSKRKMGHRQPYTKIEITDIIG